MAARDAACHRGQLQLELEGDPLAVSICNCRAYQRRTGSALGIQARFKADHYRSAGASATTRGSPRGGPEGAPRPFCPDCGSHVFAMESAGRAALDVFDLGLYAEDRLRGG